MKQMESIIKAKNSHDIIDKFGKDMQRSQL